MSGGIVKPKLNILFANSIQMFAGGEVWMLTTIDELKRRGHQVTLLCRPNTKLAERARHQGIDLITLKMRGDFDPVTIFHIYRLLKNKRIDVILNNMEKELRLSGVAAKLARIQAVVSRRGIDYPLKNKLRYRFTYNFLTTRIVANSESTKRSLLSNAPWLNPNRIQVIYNGIDPDKYSENETTDLREEFNVPKDSPIIGFVGQLNERKGFDTLLPAFNLLLQNVPNAILLIAGKGDTLEQIKHFADENQIKNNIKLIGFRDDVPNIMRTIDLLVLPSWWEGFGIVLIEAMAASKPVITTNISSMPEIITHAETGLIVSAKNIEELYEAMHQLITDSAETKKMGQRAHKVVEMRFTLQRMVDQYENLFFELARVEAQPGRSGLKRASINGVMG